MTLPRRHLVKPLQCARAFTLVEAVISILIVAVMLSATLATVGAALRSQAVMRDRAQGLLLAQDLMSEILQQHYQEPFEMPVQFGPEASETGGTRAMFDDVDDYNNYTDTPPQMKDGSAIPNLDGWSRTVKVEWVLPDSPGTTSPAESGVKRITVTIRHNGKQVASLVMISSDSWQQPPYQ